ncbi:MAG: hypothetical protein EA390_14435 [Balneolaceae bacterium]|nr:MAG: hypothetical protein EA390_14435 [Balneolaceae bacterium]
MLVFPALLIISLIAACGEHAPEIAEATVIEVTELRDYDRLTSENDLLLGVPVRIRHDHHTGHVFIQDVALWAVIELDEENNEVRRYGTRGRGPGEIQSLDDFFITKEHLFIVDGGRFLIHKYSREDGQFISSLDYGELLLERTNGSEHGMPLPPQAPLTSNNNRPFVTLNESILLPSQTHGEFLYRAVNWQGEKVGDIGEIPDGYTNNSDDAEVRMSLQNQRVPAHELALAFPVDDPSDLNEIYLVYSAIPKIAKYNLSGNKIWEQAIPSTPEVDSLMVDLSNVLDTRPNHRVSLLPVKKYMAGRSNQQGEVFLFTYTNMDTPRTPRRPMWIHQFDSKGTLVDRYKIISDTDLFYYPGIDFENRRIFTPSFNESDIRMYPF